MAWEPGQNHYTLLLQKLGNGKTKIYHFHRVKNREGTEYLEPIPSETMGQRSFQYDAVEYFVHPGTQRGDNATPLSLTVASADEDGIARKG